MFAPEDFSMSAVPNADMKDCRMTKPSPGDQPIPAERPRGAAHMTTREPEAAQPTGARLVRALRTSLLGDLDLDRAPVAGPVRKVEL